MDYGKNMLRPSETRAQSAISKLLKLAVVIEEKSIHYGDHDYRWVKDRLEYMEKAGRQLNKEEMEITNKLWRQYG